MSYARASGSGAGNFEASLLAAVWALPPLSPVAGEGNLHARLGPSQLVVPANKSCIYHAMLAPWMLTLVECSEHPPPVAAFIMPRLLHGRSHSSESSEHPRPGRLGLACRASLERQPPPQHNPSRAAAA